MPEETLGTKKENVKPNSKSLTNSKPVGKVIDKEVLVAITNETNQLKVNSQLTVNAFNEVKELKTRIKELEAKIQESEVDKQPELDGDEKNNQIKWNKSWTYSGPQHIPNELKDPRFEYGWVDYLSSGKLSAAQRQHWEVDREIRKKLGEGYTLPTLDHSIPIEGALIVGSSLLVRRLKEIGKQIFAAEQALVPEPRKVAKARLQAEIGSDIQLVGDVNTRI